MARLAVLGGFGDGRVWRAFDHLIATGPGRLLLVPVVTMEGDFTRVTDGCPVPWQEVWAVLDAPLPAAPEVLTHERLARLAPFAAVHFSPFGWVRDVVPARACVPTLTRLTGPCGARLAWLGDGDA